MASSQQHRPYDFAGGTYAHGGGEGILEHVPCGCPARGNPCSGTFVLEQDFPLPPEPEEAGKDGLGHYEPLGQDSGGLHPGGHCRGAVRRLAGGASL